MKNNKYYVWFYGKFEIVYAGGVETAAILATAKRISAGLHTQITMIELEKEDGFTEFVFGQGNVRLFENTIKEK